ncbi:MAG: phage tail protein [Gammaproteobacteria bacterium]|nr:MAG: phage tail protein [Gammaproteobacteria bacterium]
MALTKADIKSDYPIPAYNYRVSISDGDDTPAISFVDVSGLSMEYEAVTYKHGFSFVMGTSVIPGMQQPIRLSFHKGIMRGKSYLYDWIYKTHHEPFFDKDKRDILIDLCDEAGEPLIRWKVRKAMPVKLEAAGFDANSSEVIIESMELIAHDLSVEYIT